MDFAYVHCKPDGTPFYVGKGKLRRARYFGERNPYHKAVVEKYGRANLLVGMLGCSTPAIAYQLEEGLIKCLTRMGVRLCNFTSGGEGGKSPTPETRAKLSAAAKKRGVSEACQLARNAAKRGAVVTPEHREKLRAAAIGRVFSAEHRKNISIAAKLRAAKFGMPRRGS